MSNEITYFGSGELIQQRDPAETMVEIEKAAKVLKGWIQKKQKPVIFNGEQYLEREDWGLIGMFWGCTAKPLSTEFVEFQMGEKIVRGWQATAVVVTKSGMEIGRAESMCLDEEENWGAIPKYEWVERLDDKGKKIWDPNLFNGKGGYVKDKKPAGTECKPMFQLRSMAQTRAEAKALKSVFSFVAVLAGFAATPAEEMVPDHQDDEAKQQKRTAPEPNIQPKSAKRKAQEQPSSDGDPEKAWISTNGHDPKHHITFKQGKFIYVVMKKSGCNEQAMRAILENLLGVKHRNQIPNDGFQKFLDAIDPDFKGHDRPKHEERLSDPIEEEEIPF